MYMETLVVLIKHTHENAGPADANCIGRGFVSILITECVELG